MDAHGTDALRLWRHFLSQAFVKRLDADKFAALVPLQQSRSPLSPTLIADLLLRPDTKNSYSPDPLVPGYVDVLLNQHLVTPAAVLFALAKYSSSRLQAGQNEGEHASGGDGKKTSDKTPLRWANSYTIEQVIFLRLAKAVKQDNAVRHMRDAVDMVKVLIRWMGLFSDIAAAFAADVMGAMHRTNIKLELECSRAAFVLLLSSVCEDPTLLTALSGKSAKGMLLRCSSHRRPLSLTSPMLTCCNSGPQTTIGQSCQVHRNPPTGRDTTPARHVPHADPRLPRTGRQAEGSRGSPGVRGVRPNGWSGQLPGPRAADRKHESRALYIPQCCRKLQPSRPELSISTHLRLAARRPAIDR